MRERSPRYPKPPTFCDRDHSHFIFVSLLIFRDKQPHIKFPVGTPVYHTHFNFRGVVTAWDSQPRFDVTRWDGVQHIDNPMEKPFYTVVPDGNDASQVFGINEKHPRYVCEDNLVPYSEEEDGGLHKQALEVSWRCKCTLVDVSRQ